MKNLNLEDIKRNLENRIEKDKALLKAWESVTFPTKKDGNPYKIMSRNFKGATYGKKQFAIDDIYQELCVYTHEEKNGYISDGINCYRLGYNVEHLYDLDEIKQAINERIEKLKENIDAMEKELAICDIAFIEYTTAIEKAQKQLEERTIINDNRTLYYMMYN